MCGKVYKDSDTFLKETTPVKDITLQEQSGLFTMEGLRDTASIGVFRNCICGSTLLADFHDRRDSSQSGNKRRDRFDMLLNTLCEQGIDTDEARMELRRVLRGENSDKLRAWLGGNKHPHLWSHPPAMPAVAPAPDHP
ncbi:MAG: oxidoreductase [Kiritimatiellia bacterium]